LVLPTFPTGAIRILYQNKAKHVTGNYANGYTEIPFTSQGKRDARKKIFWLHFPGTDRGIPVVMSII